MDSLLGLSILLRVKGDLMPFNDLWDSIQNLALSQYIGFSYWFPLLESLHVLSISLVVGTILWIDLRLLGLAAISYKTSKITKELLPWVWASFFVAVLTGVGLFMARAGAYAYNPAFQIKMFLIVLACANMSVFHFRTVANLSRWDSSQTPPVQARVAGALSLFLWVGVILSGRWIGHLI